MSDYEIVAEKRPWVPDWLWRVACLWMPLAEALSWAPRCQWPMDSARARTALGGCPLAASAHFYGAAPDHEYLGRFCDYHGAIAMEDATA